jgi:NAD(P)-dependent dehydrogenase (short-subunit alcohol dehydrogenase family)
MPKVLITGANRGIGLEFATQYAEAGWRVFACARDPEQAERLQQLAAYHTDQLSLHTLDISDFAQINQLAAELGDQEIDLLINNAGIYADSRSRGFGATNYEAWMQAFEVNTMAPLKMAEAFGEAIARSQHKKIINLTSKMGSIAENTSGGCYLYRSSKAALNMVTKSLALDLAPRGIVAAVLHPGWVKTDMGGPNALITVQQSVTGMRQVIERLTPKHSGQFYAYDGKAIPW